MRTMETIVAALCGPVAIIGRPFPNMLVSNPLRLRYVCGPGIEQEQQQQLCEQDRKVIHQLVLDRHSEYFSIKHIISYNTKIQDVIAHCDASSALIAQSRDLNIATPSSASIAQWQHRHSGH